MESSHVIVPEKKKIEAYTLMFSNKYSNKEA
jgi:hypothetical protein